MLFSGGGGGGETQFYGQNDFMDIWAFLINGGGGTDGGVYATFVWQERARLRAKQMKHMPSLKPL